MRSSPGALEGIAGGAARSAPFGAVHEAAPSPSRLCYRKQHADLALPQARGTRRGHHKR
jgi:hypothetical protein